MSVVDVAHSSDIRPVDARRTNLERIRDGLDPYWRWVLWTVATLRALRIRKPGRAYRTWVVDLDEVAAARAREIAGRRLKP
jgi:hypothetical protein